MNTDVRYLNQYLSMLVSGLKGLEQNRRNLHDQERLEAEHPGSLPDAARWVSNTPTSREPLIKSSFRRSGREVFPCYH